MHACTSVGMNGIPAGVFYVKWLQHSVSQSSKQCQYVCPRHANFFGQMECPYPVGYPMNK